MFLPLLHLRKPPVEQLARLRASWVCCVSVCRCVCASRQDVRSIYAGEVNPVTLTCCGFEAPTSSATFSVILPQLLLPLLSECVFFFFLCSKTPKVIFSSTSHTFTWNPAFLGNCVVPLFFSWIVSESKTEDLKFFLNIRYYIIHSSLLIYFGLLPIYL